MLLIWFRIEWNFIKYVLNSTFLNILKFKKIVSNSVANYIYKAVFWSLLHIFMVLIFFSFQLLDCYFEAYQHIFDRDEKRAMAQVMSNLMNKRPRFDFDADYFIKTIRAECVILRHMTTLIKNIMDKQVPLSEWGIRYWIDLEISLLNDFIHSNKLMR